MKKIIIIICILLFIFVFCFIAFIEYNKHTQQIVVLSYHNIVPDNIQKSNESDTLTLSEFENEMNYLKQNEYTTISAKELFNWKNNKIKIPNKSVLITFDDGYYSFKYLVQPILEKYDFKAICFLIGNSIPEKTPKYDENNYGTIGKDEIFSHPKNIEYGSHTYAMHSLTENNEKLVRTLSKDSLRKDIEQFNSIFPAEYLAYPYYTYTSDFIDVLKEFNYKLAFAGEEEMVTKNVDNYKIPRISGVKSFEEFKQIFETDQYKNKYGNGFIRKVFVTLNRFINK